LVLRDAKGRLLYHDLRDQDPDVWEPACHRLGEMAAADPSAYRVLCDLLLSRVPELRLRGLVALRILAPAKPVEVGRFLTDRVAEARVNYDPVLLDVTFFAFTALPKPTGKELVAGYLTDPHEGIRASAAAALCFWPEWPGGTLERLAGDSSVEVRAGLLTALAELEDSPERSRALAILRQQQEPLLTELLDELEQEALSDPPDPVSAPLSEVQITRLLHSARPKPVDISRLEQAVSEDPELGVMLVREGLESSGSTVILQQLADLCRTNGLGTLFRTWGAILRLRYLPAKEFLLGTLGVLDGHSQDDFLLPLREFLKSCARAVDGQTTLELVEWCKQSQEGRQNSTLLSGLALAPEAWEWLEALSQTGAEFEGASLFQLSHLKAELIRVEGLLEGECPRPERDLLQAVINDWQRTLSRDIELMMGGEVA